ncbi:MAG: mandelate racemase/muconate lactonizing enzyme family protein [Chloroflexi bacterium]|nr:mandelate racemase/muconate lactonizing enzyme family protein [Chloroflexota bacterium]MCI0882120.1 mandelate racemase/muconate lactonizing enzyme family protein [Chloroflexota bacterium]
MKITKVETIHVDEFWQMCWVRVHTDSGHIGLGETWYLPRSVAAVVHELFGPTLIGRDPMDREGIWDELFKLAGIFTYSGAELRALSAIDIALWDVVGQALDEPIYNLLGGKSRDRIRIYNTIGSYGDWQDNEFELRDPVGFLQSLIDDGITTVKAYYMAPYAAESGGNFVSARQIREGLAPLAKQRKALGDQIEIAHDGGGQWALAPAIRIVQAMEEYDLLWQEEMIHPLNVETHLKLASETKTPICAAERLMTRFEFREYIEKGAAEIVMPDLVWTGGITETKKIAVMADTYQTPIAPHDWTGPVNVFACAHISMNCPNVMIQETNRAYYRGWYDRFIEPNIVIEDGYLLAPEGPGLGTRLKAEVFDRSDVHVEETTEAARWEAVGFVDPGQRVSHFFSPEVPEGESGDE